MHGLIIAFLKHFPSRGCLTCTVSYVYSSFSQAFPFSGYYVCDSWSHVYVRYISIGGAAAPTPYIYTTHTHTRHQEFHCNISHVHSKRYKLIYQFRHVSRHTIHNNSRNAEDIIGPLLGINHGVVIVHYLVHKYLHKVSHSKSNNRIIHKTITVLFLEALNPLVLHILGVIIIGILAFFPFLVFLSHSSTWGEAGFSFFSIAPCSGRD